jgi:hypothetical protein
MTRSFLLAAVCIAALSTTAFSQGQYLKDGENGVGLNASMEFGDEETTIGGGVGYSYLGRFDVQAVYSRLSVKTHDEPSVEFGGNNFGAGVTIHPLKQTETIPVGLALTGIYMHSTVGGGDLDALGIDGTANAFGFGGILHSRVPLGNSFALLGGAGYTFTHVSAEFGDVESTDNINNYPLTLEGIFSVGDKGRFVFGPSFTISKDENVLGVSAMYVIVL